MSDPTEDAITRLKQAALEVQQIANARPDPESEQSLRNQIASLQASVGRLERRLGSLIGHLQVFERDEYEEDD